MNRPAPMPTLVAYPAFKNRATNPYQALLYDQLQRLGWRVLDLDTAARRLVRPDIVHLHWPDGFAFHRGLAKTLFRSRLLLLMCDWYRLRGARIVWTLHNLRSHERFHPRLEARFWQRLYRRLDGWIALNQFSTDTALGMPLLRALPHATIPHGLYPRLGDTPPPAPRPAGGALKRLLLFGKIRPYKEIPLLLEAFAGLRDPGAELTIAGQCHDALQAGLLERKAAELKGLRVMPRFIPDAELDRLIQAADCIVIPYAGSLNSGVIFLALAYGKPVIAPATPTFMEIAADFGPGRVRLFDPPLDSARLRPLLHGPLEQDGPGGAADPQRYTWPSIAAAHDAFLRELIK